MKMHNLLSLPHLPIGQTRGKKPLINYSKSQFITFDHYLKSYKKRPWTRQQHKKSRNEVKGQRKESKKIIKMVIGFKRIAHKLLKKCARVNFVSTSTTNFVKEASDHFHDNFRARFKAHSLGYTCVNLGFRY
jgi:regulator of PEP synthase PpsR (kinase-PPPase family)